MLNPALNIFFFVFHSAFTVFNIVGWIFPATRKWHLLTIFLTAVSWFVLGIKYGWGYCVCTDWHWQVREAMGIHDRSHSYIHFLLETITGTNWNEWWVEKATVWGFSICAILSIILNVRDWRRRASINS